MKVIYIDKGHSLPDIIHKKNLLCYYTTDYYEAYHEYKGEKCFIINGTNYKYLQDMLDNYPRRKTYFYKKLKTCELLVIINDAV